MPDAAHPPRWSRLWLALACLLLLIAAALAHWGKPGYTLSAFSDLTELGCLLVTAFFMVRNAFATHGPSRVFWSFSAVGVVFWIAGVAQWTEYEVILRKPVAETPLGDTLLFLKLVPLVAGLAVAPDTERTGRLRIYGFLDLSFLLVYWFYFYAIWVIPYRYVVPDDGIYGFHFNTIDSIGHILFVIVLGIVALRAEGSWRTFFRTYWAGFALYTLSATIANIAIDEKKYYSGSFYDLPLFASVAAVAYAAILAGELPLRSSPSSPSRHGSETSSSFILLPSRIAMLATLSTPLIGFVLLSSEGFADKLGHFHILTTLLATLILTLLLSLKQILLSSDLIRSLSSSSHAYQDLANTNERLLQIEKLASLGQVVARVANEVRNAMRVILKSSAALLKSGAAGSGTRGILEKIFHQADRTEKLATNMLGFACESPLEISPVDLRQLLSDAIGLTRASRQHQTRVEIHAETDLPRAAADANRILQVFLQIMENAIDATEEKGRGSLLIGMRAVNQHVEVEFADDGVGLQDPERVFDPFYTTKPVGQGTGLGLSTCYGIVRQHQGEITCRHRPGGGAIFTVSLPKFTEDTSRLALASVSQVEGS